MVIATTKLKVAFRIPNDLVARMIFPTRYGHCVDVFAVVLHFPPYVYGIRYEIIPANMDHLPYFELWFRISGPDWAFMLRGLLQLSFL